MTATSPHASSPEVTVRPRRPDDEGAIIDLLQTCFPSWRDCEPRERFRWKHDRSPFGQSQCALAESGGRLVGFIAWMPWRAVLDGRVYPAWRGVDLAVHPSVQRRGIYQRMRAYRAQCPEEQDLSFNHRNERSEGALRKAGFASGSRIAQHVAPLWPHRAGLWYLAGRAAPSRETRLRSVADALADEAGIEDLISRSQPEGRLATDRSLEYLRWRYGQYPGRTYLAETLRETDGRLRGLLVGRYIAPVARRRPPGFEVSEVIVPEADRHGLRRLLRRVWRTDAAYATVVAPVPLRGRAEAWVAGFPVRREFARFGAWALRDAAELPADLGSPRRWMIPLGDLEAL